MASCSSAYGRRTCWPRRTWRAERRPSVAIVLDVLLLITGASGAGKSSVRTAIARELCPVVECVELRDVVAVPVAPTLAWRQRATEAVVRRALELQRSGRHLLLSGDPVGAGEVVAAPSAPAPTRLAVGLLDLAPEVQASRLAARGDDRRCWPIIRRLRSG